MNLSRVTRRRMPFLLDFFSLFYPSYADREEKRRQLHANLRDGGSVDAEKALDYLSEIGGEAERASAKFDMARIFVRRGEAEQVANYVLEAAPLAGDTVRRSIARIVTHAPLASDYLSEIDEMIAAWEMHRSGDLENFAHRLAEMGNGLTLRTFSETRLAFLRDALEGVEKPERRITQRLRIASVLMELVRWEECEEQQRHALAEARELANAELVARASNDLAQLLHRKGRFGEAESLMRRALELCKTACGAQHPTVAICLNNLVTLLHATNRPEEAETLMRKALKIDVATFGEQHPTVAIRLSNLAQILRDTNRLEEAEPLMRKALEIDETAFGKQHPKVAVDLGNLATLLWDTKRIEESESLMRRALEVNEAVYGEQHPNVARDLNNLALLLKNTNRSDKAEPLMRRSIDILNSFGRQTGREHGDFQIANANYEALQRAIGPDRPD